ncbi:alpha/beta-hydrolase [Nadsonia fulvescens var. elongata DSM 6958]|uniref:Palmitoyl-protein thioesterase 1 n=1 Tax=Nadsonia fulvescens var. elongata DSM 6958 TaxID=857566 RepID=A0A1E3PN33_9ASCO|nr:alpha/beta-hydrolase [Nadsonia fulvescens var. elongata DSM 6958]
MYVTYVCFKVAALPTLECKVDTIETSLASETPLPVVLWHGLGDHANSAFMIHTAKCIQSVHPGTLVHSIQFFDSPSQDQQAGLSGNLTSQLVEVCQQLNKIPGLGHGFDALGFSQGGLFLRGYMERCTSQPSSSGDTGNDGSMCGGCLGPSIRNLITFGSPHNGVFDLPNAWRWWGGLRWRSIVWRDWTQGHVVVSQYFRDPNSEIEYENYLKHSNFLADVNNEREVKTRSYGQNLARLNKLVLIMFEDDEMIKPKESAWFWEFNQSTKKSIKLEDRDIYKQDWIGLKQLDQKNGIVYMLVGGGHMEVTDELVTFIAKAYLGKPANLEGTNQLSQPDLKFIDQAI